jgi:AcrR family transcriptional regulator
MPNQAKRVPRAVRERQMLDAAVRLFAVNGYHETSMDAIAAEADVSKPMVYLYCGSKEELFGACLNREMSQFIEAISADVDVEQNAQDLLRTTISAFLSYVDTNRASWRVLYTQAISSQRFAQTIHEGREQIIELVGRLLRAGTRSPEPGTDFDLMAVALVGAGEAVATRISTGGIGVDEASALLISLFWRGLKGTPGGHDVDGGTGAAVAG